MKDPRILYHKCSLGKYAMINSETGEVMGYTYMREPSEHELSRDIDNLVLDETGCINGDEIGFDNPEEPSFFDLLIDDRYGDD